MSRTDEQDQSVASVLCKACGLCCTGHLFAWAKLRADEMEGAGALGLKVLGSDPKSRGFSQPCPLWDGECTIYTSPQYPHFCGLYKCKLLKKLMDESIQLSDALGIVEHTKQMIRELELRLPPSSTENFRERLLSQLELETAPQFRDKARSLLLVYKHQFGVKDLMDHPEEAMDLDP